MDAACSTPSLLSFLVVTLTCKNGKGVDKRSLAWQSLKELLQHCNFSQCWPLKIDPESLQACEEDPHMQMGLCKCCFKVHSDLLWLYGQEMHTSVDAVCFFFKEAVNMSCCSMGDW